MKVVGLTLVCALAVGIAAAETKYEQAQDFTLVDVAGDEYTLSEMLATGPVYMVCWDLPCVNCIEELDALVPVYEELAPYGLQIIALSVDKPADEAKVKAFVAAKRALKAAFETDPVEIREGGSIPIVATFAEVLKAPCVLMGFGLPDQNIHGPNENLQIVNYHKGTRAVAAFFSEMAKLS